MKEGSLNKIGKKRNKRKLREKAKKQYRIKKEEVYTKAKQKEVTNATRLSCTCAESSAQWEGVDARQTSNPREHMGQPTLVSIFLLVRDKPQDGDHQDSFLLGTPSKVTF